MEQINLNIIKYWPCFHQHGTHITCGFLRNWRLELNNSMKCWQVGRKRLFLPSEKRVEDFYTGLVFHFLIPYLKFLISYFNPGLVVQWIEYPEEVGTKL